MLSLKKSVLTFSARQLYKTRTFLTDSYKCNEVWQERLNCSMLKKVDSEVLYHKLSTMLDNEAKQINAVDLDIFANSLTDKMYIEELDDLTHKFRLSAQAGTLLPSTHHAVIRFFLESENTNDLIRILRDRLNYGIFPDYYLSNLLMDTFIKENNFRNAAVIISNQMLQEELDNDITKAMGLYSCLKYISNPSEWNEVKVEEEEQSIPNNDDEEEIKRVRVDFIRNPYFDDHFDLADGNHLVGKTMLAISKTDNTVLGNSFKTLGLVYYNKWNELDNHLKKLEGSVYSGTLELTDAVIDKQSPENSEKLKNALSKLKINNKNLEEETNNFVIDVISKNEEKEIQLQKKVCKHFLFFILLIFHYNIFIIDLQRVGNV